MPATSLFNSAVTAFAISAADEIGFLEDLQSTTTIDLETFAQKHDLHQPSVRALVDMLAHAGIVTVLQQDPIIVAKDGEFDDVWQNKGYFRWLIRGYGEMLSRAGDFCRPAFRNSTNPMHHRDGRAIAIAGKDYGGHFVDPIVDRAVDGIDFSVGIDLGCGSANRLIRLARRHPGKRFIGVDVDRGAVDVAREAVTAAGLTERITVVHDDIRDLRERPEYADADLAVSFFLGHDFWPRQACLDTLEQIRRRLPGLHHFLLADTYRSPEARDAEAAVFTLGFELTHALMGQQVPTRQEWIDLFGDSVWDLHGNWPLHIAHSEIFHLVPGRKRP